MNVAIYQLERHDPQLTQFHRLEEQVAQEVRDFLPRPRIQLEQSLFHSHYQTDEQKILLATVDDMPCARLVARVNPTVRDDQGAPLGLIGYFAAHENKEAVQSLFDAALDWFNQQGVKQVIGPVSSHFWYESGINLGPFNQPPFLFEPNNPGYYGDLWEECGFQIFEDLNSYQIDDLAKLSAALQTDYDDVLAQDYTFRPLRLSRFDEEMALLQTLVRQAQSHSHSIANALTCGFIQRLPQIREYFDPRLTYFVMDDMQREVGFIYSLVDHLRAVQQKGRGSGLTRLWRVRQAKRQVQTIDVNYLAVARPHQHRQLAKGLIYKLTDQALRRGYRQFNFTLVPTGNPVESICRHSSKLFRRYRLFTLWL
jgi:GNAT superfamily N-acetyltransferase